MSLSRHLKLILVGIILMVFGVTLVVTSYPKIYVKGETIIPTAHVLAIQANSSSDFFVDFDPFFGTIPIVLGAILVGVSTYRRKGIDKEKSGLITP